MITCERVGFGYGARELLRELDLTVGPGELCGVIGPNGAGKSTLARLLLGLLAPRSGRVLLDGRDVSALPPRQRARAMAAVLQDEPLDFPFTALEVVLLGRLARLPPLGFERPEDLEAARAAMIETGVAELADRPVVELSGGERKRVLLARALAQAPSLLVLDEPAAALDLGHQLELFARLRARQQAGAAIVVVVHDLNLAASHCSKLVLLAPGAPAIVGRPDQVLTEARVRAAFGVDVVAVPHPLSGARLLFPRG